MRAVSNGPSGRAPNGRFTTGNRHGRGNPNVRRLGEAQAAVREAASADDVRRVLLAVRDAALDGDVQAARVYLDRVCGPATAQALERETVPVDPRRDR